MPLDVLFIINLLKSFTSAHHLLKGQQLHALLLKSGHLFSLFSSNSLLHFYSRCSPNPQNAHNLFDSMLTRNSFSFNTVADSYLNSNDIPRAISLFRSNPQKNSYSWTSIINGLVKIGDLDNARTLFDEMPVKDVSTLNSLIHVYLKSGKALDAFWLYKLVGLDDKFVLTTAVSGCADYRAYELGKQIHARILITGVELDSVLRSALVDLYGKCEDLDNACRVLDSIESPDEFSLSALVSGFSSCGRVEDARRVFYRKRNPSAVLWNSMINGYVLNECGREAIDLFSQMKREEKVLVDSATFASIFSGCATLGIADIVKQIHACGLKHGVEGDVVVASALIDSYSKCGEWESACRVFDEGKIRDTVLLNSMINVYSNCGMIVEAKAIFDSILNKSIISWNSMIVGYSQNGCAIEALDLFSKMHRFNLRIDKVALASAVSASASICALSIGEQLFSLATIIGLDSDPIISTSVIDLYCKCGNLSSGWRVFNWITKTDKALWNSMMMGYATNGYGTEVLKMFKVMRSMNISPNEVTFIAILSGCCHSGLVKEGMECFYRMKEEYGIDPKLEHYSLVIDLLVRVGKLKEAVEFIDTMPYAADVSLWTSVLGGCKADGDENLRREVEERLVKLEPSEAGPLLQLSSIYAAHGKWETSERIREMMRERRIRKNPGYSWIDN
ncbi:uncharacterized protein A4U43_C04F29240 [Asparagus officinalis]|uniref:Pentacotripeptide-repeat region of PRORP domain-containing protein n=1 Tax=Asparagus officinalis TaxID=4686 RepID=A0A5P1F4I2_ASPOF|nr:putative pentatricopeptide repeat-containing protein At1g77010, mitochondrial [Asparagus officinalis]ONK73275.1 uncharacterized protein A4U43_C04F29240 [Asparagus officinalis]